MWMMKRSAGMELLELSDSMYKNKDMTRAYLEARGANVREVAFRDAQESAVNEVTRLLATFCPNLRSFRGALCHGHEALAAIANGCPLLEEIRLPGGFTDETIDVFARTCPRLKEVRFESDDAFTEAALLRLLRNCRLLEGVSINGDETELTDRFFVTLAQCCPLLTKLVIYRTEVTEASFEALAVGCPNLQSLTLFCGRIEVSRLRGDVFFPALT
jgi:hypothetical protein